MKFVLKNVMCDFGKRARELNASWTSSNHNKVEWRVPASFGRVALRQLKRQQYAPPNFDGIFHRLEARGQRFPFIVTEISMARARSNDQIVVRNVTVAKLHNFPRKIEIFYFPQKHLNIAIASKNPANRGGDFTGGQAGRRDLIEPRPKSIKVPAVDYGDADRISRQCSRGEQASKAGADYNHMRTGLAVHPCTLYDSNRWLQSRKVFLGKPCPQLFTPRQSRASLPGRPLLSGYRSRSDTVCWKQLCGLLRGDWISLG